VEEGGVPPQDPVCCCSEGVGAGHPDPVKPSPFGTLRIFGIP